MNVRTIALASTLIVPVAAAFAAEGVPYTGPNKPVITTASNDVVTQDVYGWRNIAGKDNTQAMKYAPTDKEIYGWRNKDTTLLAMKDAPINKENHGWPIIAGKDKTLAMPYGFRGA